MLAIDLTWMRFEMVRPITVLMRKSWARSGVLISLDGRTDRRVGEHRAVVCPVTFRSVWLVALSVVPWRLVDLVGARTGAPKHCTKSWRGDGTLAPDQPVAFVSTHS